MTIKPNAPDEARLKAVAAALRARDAKTAAALAETDLARGVQHPVLFNARALWLAEAGRHQEALGDFARAAQLWPTNAAIWSAQGVCLAALRRFDEADEAFDKAITLLPNSAALLCQKGSALEQAQNLVAARIAYLRALECDPENADALGRLAFLAVRKGAWSEARAFAERAIRKEPTQPTARLAIAASEVQEGQLEQAERHLFDLLGDETIAERRRSLVLAQLGDLRDRQDRTEEAFQAYAQANSEFEKLHLAQAANGEIAASEIVRMRTAYFGKYPSLPRPRSSAGSPAETAHVFLIGFYRSGTTLLEQVLASHRKVVTLEERNPIGEAVRDFMMSPHGLDALSKASEKDLDVYRDRYWHQVRKHGVDPAGKLFVDKGPMYTIDLPVIAKLFPRAKILFAIRDPRDVVLSCFRSRFEMNAITREFLTLDGAAKFYAAAMRLGEIYRAVLPLDLCEVRHELFVSDLETEARRLCATLGLIWDEAMLNFADRAKTGALVTVSARQIARGLNRDGIGRWHRYADQLAPVLPMLQPWVENFGYLPDA